MKKDKKLVIGPLQKMWIESLRNNYERQTSHTLGKGTSRNYKACCLGELHLCYFRMKKQKLPFLNDKIYDIGDNFDSTLLYSSYDKYGLRDELGSFKKSKKYLKNENSLAGLNDAGITWSEIADIIERNPGNVFTKSV